MQIKHSSLLFTRNADKIVSTSVQKYTSVAVLLLLSIMDWHCFAGPIKNIILPIDRILPSVKVVASLTGLRIKPGAKKLNSIPIPKQTANPNNLCVLFSVDASLSCCNKDWFSSSSSSIPPPNLSCIESWTLSNVSWSQFMIPRLGGVWLTNRNVFDINYMFTYYLMALLVLYYPRMVTTTTIPVLAALGLIRTFLMLHRPAQVSWLHGRWLHNARLPIEYESRSRDIDHASSFPVRQSNIPCCPLPRWVQAPLQSSFFASFLRRNSLLSRKKKRYVRRTLGWDVVEIGYWIVHKVFSSMTTMDEWLLVWHQW